MKDASEKKREAAQHRAERFVSVFGDRDEVANRLLSELSDEHRKLFEQYMLIRDEMEMMIEENEYIRGFAAGIRMMMYKENEEEK